MKKVQLAGDAAASGTIGHAEFHARLVEGSAAAGDLDVAVAVQGAVFPAINAFTGVAEPMDVALRGRAEQAALLKWGLVPTLIDQWAQSGGKMIFDEASLTQPGFAVSVKGEVTLDAPVKHGFGQHGTDVGNIPATIVTDQTAGEQANAMRYLCGNCKHFRNDMWVKDLSAADSPASSVERRRAVNQIRGALIQTQNVKLSEMASGTDGDLDVEQALRQLGYCMALYSFFKNMGKNNQEAMTLVHPLSTCPEDVKVSAGPQGFFEAGKDGKAAGDKNYDRLMNMAAGKV
jgi:hypothetical protein